MYSASTQNDNLPILVAEDSDEDFDLLKLAFKRFGIRNEVIRCEQGEEVLPTLERLTESDATLPGLVLLDLNLIGLDGREVLKLLKGSPVYRKIPVVVLSTSSSPKDIDTCYNEGANSYSVKPVDLERFETFVRRLKEYWLDHVILPRASALEQVRRHNV